MKIDPRELMAARQAGRSWTEISQRFGIGVREAKLAVEPVRAAARKNLADRRENKERLQDVCLCGHKQHEHLQTKHACSSAVKDYSLLGESTVGPCECAAFDKDPEPHMRWYSQRVFGGQSKCKIRGDINCPHCGGSRELRLSIRGYRCMNDDWHTQP